MRHRVYGKHLGRNKNQRTALFKGLVRSLILHESIQTTAAKAKATKGLVDRLITRGKDGSNASVNLIKSILLHQEVVKKLIEDIVPRFKSRTSGFTQIVKLGVRQGDGAMMVRMSLILDKSEGQKIGKPETKEEKVEEKVEEKTEKPKSKKENK